MIIEDIKNSVKEALYNYDRNIIFHFEKISHTGFPFALLTPKNINILPDVSTKFQKITADFNLVFMKRQENSISELLSAQKCIQNALLPVIKIKNKKVTLDNVSFNISENKLFMNFTLEFYVLEDVDDTEIMQTIDINLKEIENAR